MIGPFLLLLLAVPAICYVLFILWVTGGILRRKTAVGKWAPSVTVLVPARNERDHIAACIDSLAAQDYPAKKFEVVVIDDASTDGTREIVTAKIAEHADHNIALLVQKPQERAPAAKKQALARGVQNSTGEVVFTIDADCRAPKKWISTMLGLFAEDVGVVFGWVGLWKPRGLFNRLQHLEYISLLGVAAGFTGMGRPTMCNANNLAYRRKAFEDVDGFHGIDHVASGDDELLMQKIVDRTDWRAAFCPEATAMTFTSAACGIKGFLNQRTRWASKGFVYQRLWLRNLLFGLFAYYVSFYVLAVGMAFRPGLWPYLVMLFGIKCVADLPLVCWSAKKTGNRSYLPYFPMTEVFQILYIPWVSLLGTLGLFHWKSDQHL